MDMYFTIAESQINSIILLNKAIDDNYISVNDI